MPRNSFSVDQIGLELERTEMRIQKAVFRATYRAAQIGKKRAVLEIGMAKPRPAVDTGELRRSYIVTRIPKGHALENVAAHAAVMEFGARPFTPPMAPLLAWAVRKTRGVRKRRKATETRTAGPRQTKATAPKRARKARGPSKEAKALARRAWNAIRRRGIKARGFHARASQRFGQDMSDALLVELRKVRR